MRFIIKNKEVSYTEYKNYQKRKIIRMLKIKKIFNIKSA